MSTFDGLSREELMQKARDDPKNEVVFLYESETADGLELGQSDHQSRTLCLV